MQWIPHLQPSDYQERAKIWMARGAKVGTYRLQPVWCAERARTFYNVLHFNHRAPGGIDTLAEKKALPQAKRVAERHNDEQIAGPAAAVTRLREKG